jgi:hypothetical protein
MTELYSCRHDPSDAFAKWQQFQMTKFDKDWNVLATYQVSHHGCACKAGHHHTCRHREMLLAFITDQHVGDGWMIDYHTRLWWKPNTGEVADAIAELTNMHSVIQPPKKSTASLKNAPHLLLPGGISEVTDIPAPEPIPNEISPVQRVSDTAARPEAERTVEPVSPPVLPPSASGSFPSMRRRFS